MPVSYTHLDVYKRQASERYPTAKPLVIYVNASSEQEARDTMPGVNLIFAARLPFHAFQLMEVRHA